MSLLNEHNSHHFDKLSPQNLLKETSDVLLLNTTTFTFATLADVEVVLKIAVLLLSIIYTTDKIIYNRKRRKNNESKDVAKKSK